MATGFAQIVFLQGDEFAPVESAYEDGGWPALLAYLEQWDFGDESEYDVRERPTTGFWDEEEVMQDYLVTLNLQERYAGLQRMVER